MNKQLMWLTKAFATALLFSIAAVAAMAADRPRYSEREIANLAERNGYQQGMRDGRFDSRQGNRFDPKRNRAYKDGKYGYRDEYVHDETYRDAYRRGFLIGYEDGYNGSYNRRNGDIYDRRDRRDRRDQDDDYDYRRDRRDRDDDDDDFRRGRDNRDNNRRNGRPWWDVLNNGGIYRRP